MSRELTDKHATHKEIFKINKQKKTGLKGKKLNNIQEIKIKNTKQKSVHKLKGKF